MIISETNIKKNIEQTEVYKNLSGTDKFKQNLLLKNSKNIYHVFEQAKRLGIDYVKQYSTSSLEIKVIQELLNQ